MASSGKRKTTMAKLNRERRLVERRQEKKAKKDARKRAAAVRTSGRLLARVLSGLLLQPPRVHSLLAGVLGERGPLLGA